MGGNLVAKSGSGFQNSGIRIANNLAAKIESSCLLANSIITYHMDNFLVHEYMCDMYLKFGLKSDENKFWFEYCRTKIGILHASDILLDKLLHH